MQHAATAHFKPFNAASYRVAIVVAEFNRDITSALLKSALAKAKQYKMKSDQVQVYRVAGCVEIPVALTALADSGKFDCLVALGAIIQGETDHYKYVADIVTRGVCETMEEGLPVGFGILTVATTAQAKARFSSGGQAMEAALQTAKTIKKI